MINESFYMSILVAVNHRQKSYRIKKKQITPRWLADTRILKTFHITNL